MSADSSGGATCCGRANPIIVNIFNPCGDLLREGVLLWDSERPGETSLGAIVSKLTIENIREALEQCKGENVLNWISDKIGQTIQSKRKEAFGLLDATKMG